MRRLLCPIMLGVLLFVACQVPKPLDPWVQYSQDNWDGFSAEEYRTVAIGWCISGDFNGQEAAVWVVPHAGGYLIKRQFLATTQCTLPKLPYERLLGE
ncbi:MAG: hypothetical protein ACE5FT_01575 [Candidatus Nanoarchaeia archaeon]